MWNTFIGNFNVEHKLEIISSEHKNLTLSNTKQGTDLGMLVVPFDYKPSTHYINSKPMWMVNTSRFFQNTVVSWASCHEVKFLFEQVFVQSCKPPSFFGTNIPTPEYLFPCLWVKPSLYLVLKKDKVGNLFAFDVVATGLPWRHDYDWMGH